MISQKYRFHGYGSLKYTLSRGKVYVGEGFKIKHSPNRRRSGVRLAIVVSKKVDKKAVVRNRIRRRFYEYLRLNLIDHIKGADLIVIVAAADFAGMNSDAFQPALDPAVSFLKNNYS